MCVGVIEVNKGSLFWNRIFSNSEGGERGRGGEGRGGEEGREGKEKKVRNENKK